MVKTLSLGDIAVRTVNGLFSLNDLHVASGGESRHEPNQFVRLDQTQELVMELKSADQRNLEPIKSARGRNGGTYACRELVIAYAAWISAAFHLKVIRVFLAQQTQITPAHQTTPEMKISELIAAGNGVFISTEELQCIARVCTEKLAQRAEYYRARYLSVANRPTLMAG